MSSSPIEEKLTLRRPTPHDLAEADAFFERMIPLSYEENGIIGFDDDMVEEIAMKKLKVRRDLASEGEEYHFLLAVMDGRIVGTMCYGPSNDLLNKTTAQCTRDTKEIGCLLILKEYQGRGIAMELARTITQTMARAGNTRCCLDCGYAKAQKMWLSKLGTPHYCLKNYWQNGIDHYVWDFPMEELIARLAKQD